MKSAKSFSGVQMLEVGEESSGQRIDNYLIGRLKGVPRSTIYRLLRTGQVRVNKGRKKPHYKLSTGDQVRIPPVSVSEKDSRQASDSAMAVLSDSVLYEDDHLIVISKPSGMAVHGGSGVSYGVIEAFRQMRPRCRFLELVHRLDRDTSGCLVLAKKRSALTAMHTMLRNEHGQSMEKTYLALIKGTWAGKKQKISAALQVNTRKSGERHVTVSADGKPATSIIVPKMNYPACGAALVEIKLLTGRTHQARVHALSIGKPIAGDTKYGDKHFNRRMKLQGLNRLFLHASRLRFTHPATGDRVSIEAPLPEDLQLALESLK
jgi:23S rRNA pseudouridine955/2504/2580 synthase